MADSAAGTEKVAIAEVLDTYRDVVRWKLDGVSRDAAVRRFVASDTSLLGVVNHLVYVERYWFQVVLCGDDSAMPPWRVEPGFDWRIADDMSIEDVLADYEGECARSRKVLDNLESLDAEFPRRDEMLVARSILRHVIEEIARHAGHMDIIRELIDESTGWGSESG